MNEYKIREQYRELVIQQIIYLNQMINSDLSSGELKLRMKSIGSNLINGSD